MLSLRIAFTGLILFAMQIAGAQETPKLRDKQVLVLPVINTTGEKWADLKAKICEEGGKTLVKELTDRQLGVFPSVDVRRLLEDSKLDLQDEENWRREVFFTLGEKSGSEFVVFIAVTSATQRHRVNLFSDVPEGEVTIKCWVLNVKDRKPLLSAKQIIAKARAKTNLVGEAKGSAAQVEATRRAIREAIKQALDPAASSGSISHSE